MREFRLDAVRPIGDCAVLQVTGEVDAYTAPMLREQIRSLPPRAPCTSSPTSARWTSSTPRAWESSSAASSGSAKTAAHSPWRSALRASCASSRSPDSPTHSPPGAQSQTPSPRTPTGGRQPKAKPEAPANGAAARPVLTAGGAPRAAGAAGSTLLTDHTPAQNDPIGAPQLRTADGHLPVHIGGCGRGARQGLTAQCFKKTGCNVPVCTSMACGVSWPRRRNLAPHDQVALTGRVQIDFSRAGTFSF